MPHMPAIGLSGDGPSRTQRGEWSPFSLTVGSLLLAVSVWIVSEGIAWSGVLDAAELRGYDFLVRTRRCSPSPEILIVDFDDAAIETLGAFPIPRGLLATVVRTISAGEPELVGLDILLDKPRDADDDAELSRAIQEAGNVMLVEVFGTETLPASEPLPEYREAALDVAFANMPLDPDGHVRRMLLWMRTAEYQGLSFPIALASNYRRQPLRAADPGTYWLGATEIRSDGTDPSSTLITAWCSSTTVPVLNLLAPGFDPTLFTGKIVLVGQSSSAAKDLYATPRFRGSRGRDGRSLASGTEIHAAGLATVLGGQTVHVPGMPVRWAATLLFAWGAAALVLRTRPLYAVIAVVGLGAGVVLVAWVLLSRQQTWIPFASTEVALALTLPGGLGVRYIREHRLKALMEAERGQLMQIFERYVSPEVAAEIWNRRDEIVLEGQQKVATVLFSDLRGFTSLTAGRRSDEVLVWLNRYFDAMSEVVKRNGGMLNKFMGDGMLVVFGVPLSRGADVDARAAVRAAVEMLERVEEMNGEQEPGQPRCSMGIGLHTGILTAGNVGARDRLEYSVIGETVNLASRLEALTKHFGTSIVMSPDTRDLVREHFETAPLGEVSVRGLPDKVHVYTLRDRSPSEAQS